MLERIFPTRSSFGARSLVVGALVVASLWVTAPAKAALVQNSFKNGAISVTLDRPGQANQSVRVGGFTGVFDGATFLSYCIDLVQYFSFGTSYTSYTVAPVASGPNTTSGGMGAAKAMDISKLAAAYFSTSFTTTTTTAAFQLAVWEIVYEAAGTAYNVNSGSFTILTDTDSGAARAQANTWLANLGSLTATTPMIALTSPTQQDFITTPIPVPPSAALLAGGLLFGLWGVRRRESAG